MSLYIGSTKVVSSDGVSIPTSGSNPASPVTGQVYWDTTDGGMKQWTGTKWDDVSYGGSSFKYRQIITDSYVLGGYRGGTPYKNVNRMAHSTDVCTNLGDRIVYTVSYSSGAPSLTTAWVFAAANAHSTATRNVVGMTLATEAARAANSGNYMWNNRNDAGVAFKEHDYVFITSGSNMDKFNYTTETSSNPGIGILGDGTGGGVQAICNDVNAVLYNDGSAQNLKFASESSSWEGVLTSAQAPGNNNQQKPINCKDGVGYGGNEGTYNGGYNYRKWLFVTNAQTSTVPRPMGNIGEENYDMGQDHQYCLGQYDGNQNNRGHKFYYSSDAGYELGSGSVRTGVPGGSSGTTGWRG